MEGYVKRNAEVMGRFYNLKSEKARMATVAEFLGFCVKHSKSPAPYTTNSTIMTIEPEDVTKFIYSGDGNGKTQAHDMQCNFYGMPGKQPCACPVRYSLGTIKNKISMIRVWLTELGRIGEYRPKDPNTNPCNSRHVRGWEKSILLEYQVARVKPVQAEPMMISNVIELVDKIDEKINAIPEGANFMPTEFCLRRDKAFFLNLWYLGDRAIQLGKTKSAEMTVLKDGSIVLNHTEGKTLKDLEGSVLIVPEVKGRPNLCPVKAIYEYAKSCLDNGIVLGKGYFFPPTDPYSHKRIQNKPLDSSASAHRLKLYLPNSGLTVHSARSGITITLLLMGASKEDVAAHCKWASDRMVQHYSRLRNVMKLSKTVKLLKEGVVSNTEDDCDAAVAEKRFFNADAGLMI